jgi:hypothetical protein
VNPAVLLKTKTYQWVTMPRTIVISILTVACIGFLVSLKLQNFGFKPTDSRLIGTWLSDRLKTIENLDNQWQLSEERRDNLSKLLGKLKITFDLNTMTTEMDGMMETLPYTILDKDAFSIVIRDDAPPNPETSILETSKFAIIHFDGNDAYWVMSELGGFPEYFKRMPVPLEMP